MATARQPTRDQCNVLGTESRRTAMVRREGQAKSGLHGATRRALPEAFASAIVVHFSGCAMAGPWASGILLAR